MPEFTVSRKTWARGRSAGYFLHKLDRKMCILGQVLSQSGFPDSALEGVSFQKNLPEELKHKVPDFMNPPILFEGESFQNHVAKLNDAYLINNREDKLVKAFKKVGVDLKFVD